MSFLGRWNGIFYFAPLLLIAGSQLSLLSDASYWLLVTAHYLALGMVISTLASIVDRALAAASRANKPVTASVIAVSPERRQTCSADYPRYSNSRYLTKECVTRIKSSILTFLLALLPVLTPDVQAQQTLVPIDSALADTFSQLRTLPQVQQALADIEAREPETIREQLRMTEIPAPPFMEEERARYFLQQLRARGLEDAYIDSEGNVLAAFAVAPATVRPS